MAAGSLRGRIDLGPTVSAGSLAGVLGNADGAVTGTSTGVVIEGLERSIQDAISDAGGVALVRFGPVPAGRLWLVQRAVVRVPAAPGSSVGLYVGEPGQAGAFEDGSLLGDLDVFEGEPPLIVPGGETLSFLWAAAGVGNQCVAKIQYAVGRLDR